MIALFQFSLSVIPGSEVFAVCFPTALVQEGDLASPALGWPLEGLVEQHRPKDPPFFGEPPCLVGLARASLSTIPLIFISLIWRVFFLG